MSDSMKDMAEALEDEDLEDLGAESLGGESEGSSDSSGSGEAFSFLKRILGAEPPPKPVESYKDHALNFTGKESIAKILRGMEGIAGNLNRAVILIALGLIELYQERTGKASKSEGFQSESGELDGRDPEHQ